MHAARKILVARVYKMTETIETLYVGTNVSDFFLS
jgi:hypothetical protein